VHALKMRKADGKEGIRLWVDDLAGLLGLVEIGVVEVHPWGATVAIALPTSWTALERGIKPNAFTLGGRRRKT
jgi:DNA primase